MFRVALTGGVASGKSSVANAFRRVGVSVIDMDEVAREIVKPGAPSLQTLVAEFGSGILAKDKSLDRAYLRELILSDEATRKRVNDILHPAILTRTEKLVSEIDAPYTVIEIPLLVETGLAGRFDRVLVVDVPEHVQVERLMKRDNVTLADAQALLAAQAPRSARLEIANDVIDNTGNPEDLQAVVNALHGKYTALAEQFATAPKPPSE